MADPTSITLTRSGGFAGLTRSHALHPATLSPDARAKAVSLADKVAAAGKRAAAPRPGKPDAFSFTVEIEREGKRESFTFAEHAAPPELQELIKLAEKAK